MPEEAGEAADLSARALPFMDRLDEASRQVLLARGRHEWFPVGAVICQEGDPGDALYIVERGRVAVLKEMSDGRSTLLGYRGPGEILGEMSLVGQQPRFASLVAVEDTELLCIAAPDFPQLLDANPAISWAILNVLNDRLHAADTARTNIIQAERQLAYRVQRLTTEADRQAELARMRQESLELIAHDLRTPLAVIEGCLQMLRTTLPEEAQAASGGILDLAAHSTQRVSSLLNSLLEAARQDDLEAMLVYRPLTLPDLIESAVLSVSPAAEEAGIRLTQNVPPDLPRPRGDAGQLERVLVNLLENAISYTPSGGQVAVAAALRDGEIELSVTDTGPGVPAEYRESIFERFIRVPGVTGRRKGFGLGLYFCRQVVKAHGGRIWVEPGPGGVGSRFVFTLPVEGREGQGG